MGGIKPFYRKIFYQCKNYLDNINKKFCIITGPRKVGKTYCLRQLQDLYANAEYINFKLISGEDKQWEVIDRICKDKSSTIYLLDEITYLQYYDKAFYTLADAYTYENQNSKVKIIMTGSQPFALKFFSNLAFASDAHSIMTSFLDFEEWLVFKGNLQYNQPYNCTEDDYLDFLLNSGDFMGVESNEEYLSYCVDETIKSELKSVENICTMIPIKMGDLPYLITLTYSILLSLHDREGYKTFLDYTGKLNRIRTFFNNVNSDKKIDSKLFSLAVDKLFINKLSKLPKLDIYYLRDLIGVLLQSDLIVLNQVGTQYNLELEKWVYSTNLGNIRTGESFFSNYNITLKYPIFYINILKELCRYLPGIATKDLLTPPLLGSIVECHIRGLLTKFDNDLPVYGFNFGCEYHNPYNNAEVDYINYHTKELIEFSVKDKPLSSLHFDDVPNHEEYVKAVTSRTKDDEIYIPYYKYILQLSRYNTLIKI